MTEPSLAALQHAIDLHQAGRLDEAASLYRHAIALAPGLMEAQLNLGILLASQGKLDEAQACHRRARELAPGHAEPHVQLGSVLHAQGRFGEAAACYRAGLGIAPDHAGALYNLANLLLRQTELAGAPAHGGDRIAETFACFERHARLAYAGPSPPGSPSPKLRHDEEQREYLRARGVTAMFHLADGSRMASAAIDVGNRAAVEAQWRRASPQIVVIDDFLTPAALEKLRRFALGSTIWLKPHPHGYQTALPEFGLACPLLAQIAGELAAAYPAIFREHALRYLWGFKYDARLSGVAVHADQAAVNVNFWIAPDEANLDPQSGGLVVWDVKAPPHWDFARFNGDIAAVRAFLESSKARPTRIPHRANRAVIFDSDLFHETDRMNFRDGYENRRINLTLLYGHRGRRS